MARQRALILLIAALAASPGYAQEVQLRDPWVPDVVKAKRANAFEGEHATRGVTLRLQVQRKLRDSFDTADIEARGSITQAQAAAAGLGLIAREFERIDVARTGRITFDDYLRYLRARGGAI